MVRSGKDCRESQYEQEVEELDLLDRSTSLIGRRRFLQYSAAMFLASSADPKLVLEQDLLGFSENEAVAPTDGESLGFTAPPLDPDAAGFGQRSDKERLFLTFDDGPLHCTDEILDRLAENHQSATFFLIGRNLTNRKLRRLAIRALEEGHELGNHSYTHRSFGNLSPAQAQAEIEKTHAAIAQVIKDAGAKPERQNMFFRFPYGAPGGGQTYAITQRTLARLGYHIAWWDLDTNDWRMELGAHSRKPSRVVAVMKKARAQDVVLLHDRKKTAMVLPTLLEVLRAKTLVSLPLSSYPGVTEPSPSTNDTPDLGGPEPSQFDRLLNGEEDGKLRSSSSSTRYKTLW